MGEWLSKQWYMYTIKYHFTVKMNKLRICAISWVNSRYLCMVKKSIPKDYAVFESIHVTFLKQQDYRNGKQITGNHVMEGRGQRELNVAIKEQ